jgi:hypothetical protein
VTAALLDRSLAPPWCVSSLLQLSWAYPLQPCLFKPVADPKGLSQPVVEFFFGC